MVELVTWGGLDLGDAALYLGVPVETARARARAGLARLELPDGGEADPGAAGVAAELLDGLDSAETLQLDRAHAALLGVGAPPELPPTLHDPPEPGGAPAVRRYRFTAVATALAVGAVLFAAGYVVGGGGTPEQAADTVALTGATGATGATGELTILARDAAGNWPVELTTRGLPQPPQGGAYELRIATESAGGTGVGRFLTTGGRTTTVRLTVPTAVDADVAWTVVQTFPPGDVVLRSGG